MKRKCSTALMGVLAVALWLGQAAVARPMAQASTGRMLPPLEDGDLIFIRISNPIFRRVAQTTDSWETHVGILFADAQGNWQVAESTFPFSKFSSLAHFIARSAHGRCCITRYQSGLNAEQKVALRRAAEARLGVFYDLGFSLDSTRLYCSKFVFEVYQEATGHQVGKIETFRQLLAANPQAPLGFWRVWFWGRIPWDRRCVTTTSELKSTLLKTIFDVCGEDRNPIINEWIRPVSCEEISQGTGSRPKTGLDCE